MLVPFTWLNNKHRVRNMKKYLIVICIYINIVNIVNANISEIKVINLTIPEFNENMTKSCEIIRNGNFSRKHKVNINRTPYSYI